MIEFLSARGFFVLVTLLISGVVITDLSAGTADKNRLDLLNDCKLFIDSGNTLSPESVFITFFSDKSSFVSLPANFGYRSFTAWVLIPSGKFHEDVILRLKHSLLDSVDVYMADSANCSHYTSCGFLQPRSYPAISDVFPCFEIPVRYTCKYILLKIRTTDVCAVDIETFVPSSFISEVRSAFTFFGLYFGAVLILAAINFFLFVSAKFISSLWYSLYILFYASFQLFALGFIELSMVLNNPFILKVGTPFFANLCIVCSSLFAIEFLSLKNVNQTLKILSHVFGGFALAGAFLSLVAITGNVTFSSMAASILAPGYLALSLSVGIFRIKSIGRPAFFYTSAILVILSGIVVNCLRNFGVVSNSFFASHANIISSVLEFIIIAIALVDHISSIEKRKNDAYREVQHSKQIVIENRLKALQAQINPHFLFNALNTIAELIRIFPAKAEQLTLSLSHFFRYTLEASDKKICRLETELKIVNNFLSIQKFRYGERLHYEVKTEGEVDNVYVPSLLLQPIIENSIKYGIATLPEGGKISLRTTISEDSINFMIHDSGPGFDFEKKSDSTAHGLYNITERLKMIYGDSAKFNCANKNGAQVEITIPNRRFEDV